MPSLLKLKKAKPGKSRSKGSAIDSAQRELLEKQNQIEAQIKALQASLESETKPTRPGRETSSDTVRHGRYVIPATMTGGRRVTVIPVEPRSRAVPKRPTMLRSERNAERRQTMALLVFLAGAVIYALSHLLP